jgi:hypothetical protein
MLCPTRLTKVLIFGLDAAQALRQSQHVVIALPGFSVVNGQGVTWPRDKQMTRCVFVTSMPAAAVDALA